MSSFSFTSLILLFLSLLLLERTSDAFLIPSTSQTFTHLHQSSNSNSNSNTQQEKVKTYHVKLTHDSKTISVQIPANQTILQALELQNVKDALSLPDLPQDCRRGNCLTCSSKLLHGKTVLNNDGLSPSQALKLQQQNITLTCCSFVQQEGVHLELGVCDTVWREMYGSSIPFEDLEGEQLLNDAVAKAMRVAGEKNFNKWVVTAERMLASESEPRTER